MSEYQKIYAFLPYFKKQTDGRTDPTIEVEPFIHQQEMMYTQYAEEMNNFISSIQEAGYTDFKYSATLEEYGAQSYETLKERISTADKKLLKAILTYMVRSERFNSGAWETYQRDGLFEKVLHRMCDLYGYSH